MKGLSILEWGYYVGKINQLGLFSGMGDIAMVMSVRIFEILH